MANNLTNSAENLALKWLFDADSTPTRPTFPLKLALYTSDPTETGAAGTEVSGGAYARTTITFDTPAANVTQNDADVTFPTASASWGVVTHVVVWDSAGTPVALAYGPLASSKTVDSGDTFKVTTGSLTFTLD